MRLSVEKEKKESEELLCPDAQWYHSLSQEHDQSWCCSTVIVTVFRGKKPPCKWSFTKPWLCEWAIAQNKNFCLQAPKWWKHSPSNACWKCICQKNLHNTSNSKSTVLLPHNRKTPKWWLLLLILHYTVITVSQLSLNNFQPFICKEAQGSVLRYPEFLNSLFCILKYVFTLLLTSKLSVCIQRILSQSDIHALSNFWC